MVIEADRKCYIRNNSTRIPQQTTRLFQTIAYNIGTKRYHVCLPATTAEAYRRHSAELCSIFVTDLATEMSCRECNRRTEFAMTAKILQVFNRYRERGGEEKSVERIFGHVSELYSIEKCWFDSREWDEPGAPGSLRQAMLIGDNPESRRRVREASRQAGATAWMLHNIIPVASLGVYREALDLGIPIIQYCHNFRPFSVSGTLWARGAVCEAGLKQRFGPEVWAASWQGSKMKSAILAWHLKHLHGSGALDSVKTWIAISEFVAGKFIEAGVPRDRVVALRHSWDAQPTVPEAHDGGYYLFLGRLVEEKGVRVLIEAWAILSEQFGEQCPRLVIGGTGPLEPEVAAAAEAPHIEFRGFVDGNSRRDLIVGCRAMLGPSIWWEPLGIVTYEAYDAGKPMLAAAAGGLTETVRDGETGLLHDPGDASSLVASVVRLEELDEPARREMGARGRAWLLQEASPTTWKQRFSEILEKCVA